MVHLVYTTKRDYNFRSNLPDESWGCIVKLKRIITEVILSNEPIYNCRETDSNFKTLSVTHLFSEQVASASEHEKSKKVVQLLLLLL